MQTKEKALKIIKSLVQRFDEQKEFYQNKDYNEMQTRQDFINPFWKALGWDIDNEQGYAESYREVIHEDRIKIGGATKAPDYSFRLPGGKRLFFLEAKKPSVAIKNEIEPAYQIRRYGWSAKMPISVITNFEELAIYDCSNKPKPTDKASVARIKYLTYSDYIAEFDFIWDTFSKERVLKGSFDKYIQSDRNKKGTTTVDHDFLCSLDKWRVELAKNIALRNNVDEEQLNFLVQTIIDRIIFLRIAEDRGVEPYENLKISIQSGEYYENLLQDFHSADNKYNSGLFDFSKDKLSPEIAVDNKVIKSIIEELYYPKCPYEFSVLSVEILGSAYEQFLGKQITLSKVGGRPTIEHKPEVRKAGGVYYTPQYIVDYIVEHTVGKLIKGKTPKEVSKIKIVDPSCGSGSFLIGAYQYLLNWHKDFYSENGKPSKGGKNNPLTPMGELTTAKKKEILLNNIFGVDLDSNAVEVTKLSLLLKCMEGETKESIEAQTKMFHDRILPTLDDNIKSGNSLIDLDYYDGELDFGDDRKVKPFSWQKNFPEVFAQGGFDCVIGNPPYRTLQLGKKQESQEKAILDYYQIRYKAGFEYKVNLFALFIEKSLSLVADKGYFSFIVPNSLYNTISFKPIRKLMLDSGRFDIIMDLRYKVFGDAEIGGNAVFVHSKTNKRKDANIIAIDSFEDFKNPTINKVPQKDFLSSSDFNLTMNKGVSKILGNICRQKNVVELGSIVKVYQGIITGDNKRFLSDKAKTKQWKPILKGRDINRYSTSFNDTYVYYSPKDLWSNTDEKMFNVPAKIISRQTSDKIVATLDREGYFSLDSTHVLHLLTDQIDIKYFLGIYNSKLLNFLYQSKVQESGRVFAQVKTVNLKPLPIKLIDLKNKLEIQAQNEIVKNVDLLLQLNEKLQSATVPNRIEQIKSRIEYSEDKINEIVYGLYGLTAEEIKIAEGGRV
ncbi:MAG: N-6 DNA methylase [Bacteroidales bacterium]|nr:N-6 DNA methylase [Bacteroidales bacterium]